jgi:hypothetical protein
MLRCPRCQSTQIHRTPTESKWALLRRRMTSKRPHRCHDCGWHGWGEETGPKFTPEQIEIASRALTQPLDVAHDIGLELPNDSEFSKSTLRN